MNSQVLTMAKMDTKVKNQVLINILHCSVDSSRRYMCYLNVLLYCIAYDVLKQTMYSMY